MGKKLSVHFRPLDPDFTVLVTGGNTGLGYETAKCLGLMGARVIIACRSEQRATEAIKRMHEEYEQSDSKTYPEAKKPNVEYMHLDLGSLENTKQFIQDFRAKGWPLHVFVVNAGIAFIPREITDDGYEKQFQVNYLGHTLILLNLLPIMRQSGPDCRVIYVSSLAHQFGEVNLNNIQAQQSYRKNKFYGNSKLFLIMQTHILWRRLEGSNMSFFSLHPGLVETEIERHYNNDWLWGTWWRLSKATGFTRTSLQGATTIIKLAVDPELKGQPPAYFEDCKKSKSVPLSRNVSRQEELWRYTLDCLKGYIDEELVKDLREPVGVLTFKK